jgi:hypothetical protein
VISLMWSRVANGRVIPMTATTFIPEPRPLARHPQRPWRAAQSGPRCPSHKVEHRFAAPVVRELPPRREQRAAAGTW